MTETGRAIDPDGRYRIRLPEGWSAAPDEEETGGLEAWSETGAGTLHLVSFESDEGTDAAEELYAFLEERGVELEDDDVEDVVLEGGAEMAVAEYEAEDEEEGDLTFWLVAVATAPRALVFATYLAPADVDRAEVERVRDALATLRFGP
jgi:hypothetical protein